MKIVKKNVLLLSVGRRVSLVRAFQKDLSALVPGGKVFAADLNPGMSAACQIVEMAFAVPRVTAADYIPFLLTLCQQHDIGLIVPTIDTELLPLAAEKHRFEAIGVHLVIADQALIASCRDKRRTAELFDLYQIPNPRIFSPDALEFPCFAKPVDGSCSQNIHFIPGFGALSQALLDDDKMMFMEYIDRNVFREYTVDLYFDRHSMLRCIVPRRRIEIRGGEVSKGVTERGLVYRFLKGRLAAMKGAVGCITLQLFSHPAEECFYGIEVNPRFGGGFPLSYLAGARYPGWLIREYLLGEDIPFHDDWEEGLLMLRYDDEVLVRGYQA